MMVLYNGVLGMIVSNGMMVSRE